MSNRRKVKPARNPRPAKLDEARMHRLGYRIMLAAIDRDGPEIGRLIAVDPSGAAAALVETLYRVGLGAYGSDDRMRLMFEAALAATPPSATDTPKETP